MSRPERVSKIFAHNTHAHSAEADVASMSMTIAALTYVKTLLVIDASRVVYTCPFAPHLSGRTAPSVWSTTPHAVRMRPNQNHRLAYARCRSFSAMSELPGS